MAAFIEGLTSTTNPNEVGRLFWAVTKPILSKWGSPNYLYSEEWPIETVTSAPIVYVNLRERRAGGSSSDGYTPRGRGATTAGGQATEVYEFTTVAQLDVHFFSNDIGQNQKIAFAIETAIGPINKFLAEYNVRVNFKTYEDFPNEYRTIPEGIKHSKLKLEAKISTCIEIPVPVIAGIDVNTYLAINDFDFTNIPQVRSSEIASITTGESNFIASGVTKLLMLQNGRYIQLEHNIDYSIIKGESITVPVQIKWLENGLSPEVGETYWVDVTATTKY